MSIHFPARDKIAIVGLGATNYSRSGALTAPALAIEASQKAILDAGLTPQDIDGIIGSSWNASPPPTYIQAALGINEVTWTVHHIIPFACLVISAMNAVASGVCTTALVYASLNRTPGLSQSAASDPFRLRMVNNLGGLQWNGKQIPGLSASYSGWMTRYMHEYGATREDFGRVAISDRSYAADNPRAIFRQPLTMDEYLNARMVREPMCMLDMDVPIDGADAVVVTTAERAKDLKKKPVLIHAATYGQIAHADDDQIPDLHHFSKHVVARNLWPRSELTLKDMDIFFPYDGFSVIMMNDIEVAGYCKPGEAKDFIKANWDAATNRIKIGGKILVNPHGGALSEGGNQSAGHVREAITQLRGEGGARQSLHELRNALLISGSLFFNTVGLILRTT